MRKIIQMMSIDMVIGDWDNDMAGGESCCKSYYYEDLNDEH